MPISITVRLSTPDDAEALALIHNADNEPHFHMTAARMQQRIETHPGSSITAALNNQIVGVGECWRYEGLYRIGIHAHANHRDSNVCQTMLEFIEHQLLEGGPAVLFCTVRADFLKHARHLSHGFQEVFRSFGANLELNPFQPASFAHLEPALLERGIQLQPYASLASDSERDVKLDAIQREAIADQIHFEPVVTVQAHFRDRRLWEPFFVATRDLEYLGFASLDGTPDHVHVDAHGVARAHRQQGIGLALGAKLMAWAKSHGYAEVNDGGAQASTTHASILERLGFELEPDWVTFRKQLGSANES